MRRFLLLLLPLVPVWLGPGASAVSAQQPSESLQLELKVASKPGVVHPVPGSQVVERDAEQAIAEIKAQERSEELARELLRAPFRRPDLDRDVIGGIQSQNLNDALRRR